MAELWPIPRSLTGDGVRSTLAVLGRDLPVEVVELPSGTQIFDWTLPKEWNVREAWVEAPDGERVIDLAHSSLHVLGYSAPVDATLDLETLREHLFTDPRHPEVVPYRTSYWAERWGFCTSQRVAEGLRPGTYRAMIDSTLEDGHVTYGEVALEGAESSVFLLSTSVCHPALANDNLSGIVLLAGVARILGSPDAAILVSLRVEPGDDRATLLAPHERGSRPTDHARARGVVRRRSRPVELQAQPARGCGDRCRRGGRPGAPPRGEDARLVAVRRRRAAVLLPGLRPSGRRFLSDAGGRVPRVPLVRRRSRARATGGAGGLAARRAQGHRCDRAERHARQRVALRRAAARPPWPVPLDRWRFQRGGGDPLGAEPLGREREPDRHLPAIRAPFRGDSRRRGCAACGRPCPAGDLARL